ncbi:hypothetical protein Ahy_A01g002914 [Arachis hypogaea]|uniref:Transmembrane protein n=1 Tax=Arachis hypogaea TaxID=3818 RepID=A0A445ERS4_ARAHY|nr:hypothetical protein Ahy_A01g002914 [Arachis hypogaea]
MLSWLVNSHMWQCPHYKKDKTILGKSERCCRLSVFSIFSKLSCNNAKQRKLGFFESHGGRHGVAIVAVVSETPRQSCNHQRITPKCLCGLYAVISISRTHENSGCGEIVANISTMCSADDASLEHKVMEIDLLEIQKNIVPKVEGKSRCWTVVFVIIFFSLLVLSLSVAIAILCLKPGFGINRNILDAVLLLVAASVSAESLSVVLDGGIGGGVLDWICAGRCGLMIGCLGLALRETIAPKFAAPCDEEVTLAPDSVLTVSERGVTNGNGMLKLINVGEDDNDRDEVGDE